METIQPKTRRAVLRIAEWQEGVVEMPSGSNKVKYNSPGQIVTGDYKPGDIVFFDFSGKRKKTEHCGIVTEVSGSTVTTMEGNTGTGNDANGGAVMRRTRRVGLVTCAIRPGYPD